MVNEIEMKAESRKPEEKASYLRLASLVPGVLYGPGVANQNIKIKKSDFDKVFAQAGESHLINLSIDGQAPLKVIIKSTDRDNIKGNATHVDFYQVNMLKKIKTEIPLHFIGESRAIKELGGTLIKNMTHLNVECMPDDLVDYIEIDLGTLNEIDDHILVSDLKTSSKMDILDEDDNMIVKVAEVAVSEEPKVVETVEAVPEKKEPVKA